MDAKYQIRCSRAVKRYSDDMFHGVYIRMFAMNYYDALIKFRQMYLTDAEIDIMPEIQA